MVTTPTVTALADRARTVLEELRTRVGFDGAAVLLMDPLAGLFTAGAVTDLPETACHPFFNYELGDDPRTLRRLARGAMGAGAVDSRRNSNDPLMTAVLVPHGYGAELRAVFVDGPVCWGGISLWRLLGAAPFSPGDVERAGALARRHVSVLRDAVLDSMHAGLSSYPLPPGMLLLQHGVVVETSEGLASLLGELTQPGFEEYRHLDLVRAMATRDPHFFTVINTSAGWISVRATGLGRGRVAVSLTGAEPADLFGARVAAAGLTRREIEVTRLLCSGLTDREIARELSVSEHTAHDHVRAVRAKLGVSSRARVAAMIFADHYFDAFRSSSHITSG